MICRADARLLRQVDTDVSREPGVGAWPGAPGRLVAPVRFQPRRELCSRRPGPQTPTTLWPA